MVIKALPEPLTTLADPRDLLPGYLDYYRNVVLRKLEGLTEEQLRASILPSGWAPIELLKHVAYVERRWLQYAFEGRDFADPWNDRGTDGRFQAPESLAELTAFLHEQAAETRRIATTVPWDAVSDHPERFTRDEPNPTLGWIMFHLLQEYARHAGQLDVVRELIDGRTGE